MQGKYQQNLLLKKRKTNVPETLHVVTKVYEDDSFSMQVPEKKNLLASVKEYLNKNFATCKSLCDFQKLYTAFKENHPNVNIGFSKFCTLRPKWCVLADSKVTHSVCVCSAHQNVVLLVHATDRDLTCKDLIKLTCLALSILIEIICDPFYITIIHQSIFFYLEHHQFASSGNAPDKYDKISVFIFSQ